MNLLATLTFLANVFVNTSGHLAFKAAAVRSGDLSVGKLLRSYAGSVFIWIGLVCFILEFIIWLALLSLIPLSQAVMLGCAGILGVMFGGWLFFDEKVTLARLTAILLIAVGVVLVGWGGV
jgi:drug/metabolite transporter (DMT)-like permease